MIDLEDAVSVNQKDVARFLVSEALKAIDYKTTERVVRVNELDTPFKADDIKAIVKAGVDVIRLLKIDNPDEIIAVDKLITEVEKEIGREGETLLMAAIESAPGIMKPHLSGVKGSPCGAGFWSRKSAIDQALRDPPVAVWAG